MPPRLAGHGRRGGLSLPRIATARAWVLRGAITAWRPLFRLTFCFLKGHLYNFLNTYNFAKCLKTLQGLTPYEYIIKCWQKEPERLNPIHVITLWD
jgi:hypothetical protein